MLIFEQKKANPFLNSKKLQISKKNISLKIFVEKFGHFWAKNLNGWFP